MCAAPRMLWLTLALCVAAVPAAARAAPDEIQVYTDDINDPGEYGVELHVNYVPSGAKTPSYPGEKPSHHMLQLTPEFSYGITKTLEAGLYVPVAAGPDGNLYQNGARLRLKYIAPRTEEQPFFWGINTEIGYFAKRVSESYWALELRPIIGYRSRDWLISFNPIVDVDLSSNVSRKPTFDPALKVGKRVGESVSLGFEYFGEYGPLGRFLPSGERSHYLYAAGDIDMKGFDLNVGVGHGYANASDAWVVKAIITLPFK